jgi:DNA-binding LacI/PurR family transcriptional regulator
MLGAIADALSVQNYDLLLVNSPMTNVLDIHNSRIFRQSDGIIFIGQGNQHEHLNAFYELEKPMVVWGSNLPDRRYCTVGADNVVGGYLSTKHLLNLGRKDIVFMGDINMPEPKQRFEGYLKALKEKSIRFDKHLQIDVPFEMSHASEAINDLLQQNVSFDGAVCCSDLIALSAISALTESGLRIPEDVAVVGYDDIALASYSSPSLTTVRQNIVQGGRILVQKLMAQINGDTVTDSVLKTELIVRRSSGAW